MAARRKKASFDWGAYKGSSAFADADEMAALIENEVVVQIVGVQDDPDNAFQGKPAPRYVVSFVAPNPLTGEDETRKRGFAQGSGVDSRDAQLEGMVGYFEDGGDPLAARFAKGGRATIIVPADGEDD